jgi:lysophospholipase L1-like esterase
MHWPRGLVVHARFRDTTPPRGCCVFGFSTLGGVETHGPRYLRFAALGDSTTFGLGDPVAGGWRGWARLLAEAFAASAYDVSFCNLAIPGATAGSVLHDQLTDAVAHRPDLAALVVGVNDVLKSTWDAGRVRDELLMCAEALTAEGATLLTARFHDHTAVLPLPLPLRRPLRNRIDQLNAAWDDVHAACGGLRVDLAARPESLGRSFWSVVLVGRSGRWTACIPPSLATAAWHARSLSNCRRPASTSSRLLPTARAAPRPTGAATCSGSSPKERHGSGAAPATWGPGPRAGRGRRSDLLPGRVSADIIRARPGPARAPARRLGPGLLRAPDPLIGARQAAK